MPRRRGGDLNGWWRLGLTMAHPFLDLCFRTRVIGANRVPAGSAVVAANHVSALDGFVLATVTGWHARRMTRFLVAAEFFAKRRFAWPLRFFRQIPLHRGAADAGALDEAIRTVSSGALAGIFPEGHVNADPERGLGRGHTGVARIALGAGAPVVPVGIWGTQARWPHGGLNIGPPLRPVLAIVYGPPIEPVGDVNAPEDVRTFASRVTRAIEEQVAAARAAAGAPPR